LLCGTVQRQIFPSSSQFSGTVPSKVNPLNYVARGDIRSEEMGAKPLPDKGEIERRNSFENL